MPKWPWQKNRTKLKLLESKLRHVDEKVAGLQAEQRSIRKLAEHAGKGFVELSVRMDALNRSLIKAEQTSRDNGEKMDRLSSQMVTYMKWTIGLFVTFVTIILGIKFFG